MNTEPAESTDAIQNWSRTRISTWKTKRRFFIEKKRPLADYYLSWDLSASCRGGYASLQLPTTPTRAVCRRSDLRDDPTRCPVDRRDHRRPQLVDRRRRNDGQVDPTRCQDDHHRRCRLFCECRGRGRRDVTLGDPKCFQASPLRYRCRRRQDDGWPGDPTHRSACRRWCPREEQQDDLERCSDDRCLRQLRCGSDAQAFK